MAPSSAGRPKFGYGSLRTGFAGGLTLEIKHLRVGIPLVVRLRLAQYRRAWCGSDRHRLGTAGGNGPATTPASTIATMRMAHRPPPNTKRTMMGATPPHTPPHTKRIVRASVSVPGNLSIAIFNSWYRGRALCSHAGIQMFAASGSDEGRKSATGNHAPPVEPNGKRHLRPAGPSMRLGKLAERVRYRAAAATNAASSLSVTRPSDLAASNNSSPPRLAGCSPSHCHVTGPTW